MRKKEENTNNKKKSIVMLLYKYVRAYIIIQIIIIIFVYNNKMPFRLNIIITFIIINYNLNDDTLKHNTIIFGATKSAK